MIHVLGGDRMPDEVSTRDSILKSISDKLDSRDFTVFYDDLIDRINTAFAFCSQFGIGPEDGFEIVDETTTWSEYETRNKIELNLVKGYIAAKVKMDFDPPETGPMLSALQESIQEYEWRITNNR